MHATTIQFKRGLLFLIALTADIAGPTASSAALSHIWSQHFGDAAFDGRATWITVDPSGNLVHSGGFQGSIDFGGGPHVSSGGWDIYVTKLDTGGNHLWSNVFGGTANDEARNSTVDATLARKAILLKIDRVGRHKQVLVPGTPSYQQSRPEVQDAR